MKNSFVLYTDYLDQTEMLSDEQMGKLFRALLKYVSSGEVDKLDSLTQMAFNFIKVKLDRDAEKYEEACEKRRAAGRKGGLAKASNAKQIKQDLHDNDNDNDNVNENENENENENDLKEKEKKKKENTPKTVKRFKPPTVNEVRAYCIDGGYNIDPDAFIDFYSAKGWMVGKNKMKDWKAAVRNWARRDNERKPKKDISWEDA